jgi:signal transduction histidine kinase
MPGDGRSGVTERVGAWSGALRRALADRDLAALRIALLYTVLGFAALFLSDVLLVVLLGDAPLLRQAQALKGGVEVLLTAAFIYALTSRSRRSLRHTNARLRRQYEELQVLHRVFRHNLRNQVNIVRGHAETLLDRVDAEDADHCEQILDAGHEMERYAAKTTRINRISENPDLTRPLDLTELVEAAVESVHGRAGEVDLVTDLPERAPVRGNPTLEDAVRELVENAVVHSDRAVPTVRVGVDPGSLGERTELWIADDGPGIPETERAALQDPIETALDHASGLGLWLAVWSVRASDGELDIRDNDPRGTVVTVTLPTAA